MDAGTDDGPGDVEQIICKGKRFGVYEASHLHAPQQVPRVGNIIHAGIAMMVSLDDVNASLGRERSKTMQLQYILPKAIPEPLRRLRALINQMGKNHNMPI